MTPVEFKELFVRELDNLHKEISAFTDESKLWEVSREVKNPPGNLCFHLLGNVNHNIGAVIGKNDYIRKRDEEFTSKNISKEKLLSDITAAKSVVENVFGSMDVSELQKTFPLEIFGKQTTEYMLTYFIGHFMYHLGQINYFRRLT